MAGEFEFDHHSLPILAPLPPPLFFLESTSYELQEQNVQDDPTEVSGLRSHPTSEHLMLPTISNSFPQPLESFFALHPTTNKPSWPRYFLVIVAARH